MNNKKIFKALGLAMCAILLVVGSVAGTFAYLTSKTETVTNTFTAGKVEITLDESKVDLYGNPDGTRVDAGNEYKLIPGRTYTKDPTIEVGSDSEACYVFFKLENGLGDDVTFDINTADWTKIGETNVYYYKSILVAGETCTAFNHFTVKNDADVSVYANGATKEDAEIKVTAYAVQADGFANANAAWTATFGATANN